MYTVTTTHQPSRTSKTIEFVDYHEALNYFNCEQDEKINGTKTEWDGNGKPNLSVGGRGHDYLIKLTKVEEEN